MNALFLIVLSFYLGYNYKVEGSDTMEEINLGELFHYYISKIFIIILFVFLGLGLGVFYSAIIQKPLYSSYTTILLKDSGNNAMLLKTYGELIKSKNVLNKVNSNLGLNYKADDLKGMINVESLNSTEIIKITVNNSNPEDAAKLANEIASVFNSEIGNYYSNVKSSMVVDKAEVSSSPFNVNLMKQIVIGAFIGGVIGVVIVFIKFYFDTTVKSSEEVESKLNLPVIGIIPLVGGRK